MTWFITNPRAGTLSQRQKDLLHSYILEKGGELKYTDYPGHATQIAAEAVKLGISKVVAIGGDGTVNEIGQALAGTNTALGIVPIGSGNGLARHLKYPLKAKKAIDFCIESKAYHQIDSCLVNGRYFFCTAGIGFEANVAHSFKNSSFRGLKAYALKTLEALFSLKTTQLTLKVHQKSIDLDVFSVTFANAGQYGNNAWIAPKADIQDGEIDICTLQPFSLFWFPYVMVKIFSKKIAGFSKYHMQRAQSLQISGAEKWHAHVDGEAVTFDGNLNISCQKEHLKIIKSPQL